MIREENPIPADLQSRLHAFSAGEGRLVVLTGAGVSAESGIPTFRGEQGYWRRGSREYVPEEMATHAAFSAMPETIWAWYLYRRGVCRRAEPNAGHRALVDLDRALGDRFLLITQNVDGLHLRAGSSPERTYQIHGNIDYARCDDGCGQPMWPLADELGVKVERGAVLDEAILGRLRCQGCGGWARPHVLWFDECYDEATFRFQSSIEAAIAADLLIVVGTSGATNLPMQIGSYALRAGATIVDVNPSESPFSSLARRSAFGQFLRGQSGALLPALAAQLLRRG